MAKAKRYPRILLKLSGEALTKDGEFGIKSEVLDGVAQMIAGVAKTGTEVGVVIGGGNIWRFRDHQSMGLERTTSDTMGMLATVMNGIALQNAIEQAGVDCRVQTALSMPEVAEPFIRRRAIRHLEKGRVVIFAAGTGQPYFTTDAAAAMRALEIKADVLMKGSTVDGIYDKDPAVNPDAKKYDRLTYQEALDQRLGVMDTAAFALCRDNNLPIIVFNVFEPDALRRLDAGETVGTEVTE